MIKTSIPMVINCTDNRNSHSIPKQRSRYVVIPVIGEQSEVSSLTKAGDQTSLLPTSFQLQSNHACQGQTIIIDQKNPRMV